MLASATTTLERQLCALGNWVLLLAEVGGGEAACKRKGVTNYILQVILLSSVT